MYVVLVATFMALKKVDKVKFEELYLCISLTVVL